MSARPGRWLPRVMPGIALMPRWLVSLPAEGLRGGYRLRLRWNGTHALRPARVPDGAPCVLVVDSALPYRRKMQRFPDSARARVALLRTAREEFPLPAEELLYGLGMRGEDAYLYALPRRIVDELAAEGVRPAVVLVAGHPAPDDAAASLAAFDAFVRLGNALDLLRERRFVSRRGLLRAQLGLALGVALLAGAALLAWPGLGAGALEWRAAALREKGSALPKMYRVTEQMAQAQAEAAKLYASPEAKLPAILAALFNSVPPGHSLRSVEFKDGVLRVTGTGANAKDWLVPIGFPAERIAERPVGPVQQFSAERGL